MGPYIFDVPDRDGSKGILVMSGGLPGNAMALGLESAALGLLHTLRQTGRRHTALFPTLGRILPHFQTVQHIEIISGVLGLVNGHFISRCGCIFISCLIYVLGVLHGLSLQIPIRMLRIL